MFRSLYNEESYDNKFINQTYGVKKGFELNF